MGRKESNQTNKYTAFYTSNRGFAELHTFIIIKDTIVKLLSLKRKGKSVFTFNYFQPKHMATYIVGTQKTRLNETCPLSTPNIMALLVSIFFKTAFREGKFDLFCPGCKDNLCRG